MSERVIELISRGVLIQEDRLLVCRCRVRGHIFLPGGHVEFGESARAALTREMQEELGVSLRTGPFIGACEAVFDQERKSHKGVRRHHEVNLVFALLATPEEISRLSSQEPKIEFDWLPMARLREDPAMLLPGGISPMILNQLDGESDWLSLIP